MSPGSPRNSIPPEAFAARRRLPENRIAGRHTEPTSPIPMKSAATCLALLTVTIFPACNSTDEKPPRTRMLENRIERQDERIANRTERRRMRAEAEDRRYEDWYNRIMGR